MASQVLQQRIGTALAALEPASTLLDTATSLERTKAVKGSTLEFKCRPWSREDFVRRVATFQVSNWFDKPPMLDPLECARHGWVNAGLDTLECQVCRARLEFPAEEAMEHSFSGGDFVSGFYNSLNNGHRSICPWLNNPSPSTFLLPGLISRSPSIVLEKYSSFLQVPLPTLFLSESFLQSTFFDRILSLSAGHPASLIERSPLSSASSSSSSFSSTSSSGSTTVSSASQHSQELKDISAVLAVCGWTAVQEVVPSSSFSKRYFLRCDECQRVLGVWNFQRTKLNLEQQKHTVHAMRTESVEDVRMHDIRETEMPDISHEAGDSTQVEDMPNEPSHSMQNDSALSPPATITEHNTEQTSPTDSQTSPIATEATSPSSPVPSSSRAISPTAVSPSSPSPAIASILASTLSSLSHSSSPLFSSQSDAVFSSPFASFQASSTAMASFGFGFGGDTTLSNVPVTSEATSVNSEEVVATASSPSSSLTERAIEEEHHAEPVSASKQPRSPLPSKERSDRELRKSFSSEAFVEGAKKRRLRYDTIMRQQTPPPPPPPPPVSPPSQSTPSMVHEESIAKARFDPWEEHRSFCTWTHPLHPSLFAAVFGSGSAVGAEKIVFSEKGWATQALEYIAAQQGAMTGENTEQREESPTDNSRETVAKPPAEVLNRIQKVLAFARTPRN